MIESVAVSEIHVSKRRPGKKKKNKRDSTENKKATKDFKIIRNLLIRPLTRIHISLWGDRA